MFLYDAHLVHHDVCSAYLLFGGWLATEISRKSCRASNWLELSFCLDHLQRIQTLFWYLLSAMALLPQRRMVTGDTLDSSLFNGTAWRTSFQSVTLAHRSSHSGMSTSVQAAIAIVVVLILVIAAVTWGVLHYKRCMRSNCAICHAMDFHRSIRSRVSRKSAPGELGQNPVSK